MGSVSIVPVIIREADSEHMDAASASKLPRQVDSQVL